MTSSLEEVTTFLNIECNILKQWMYISHPALGDGFFPDLIEDALVLDKVDSG